MPGSSEDHGNKGEINAGMIATALLRAYAKCDKLPSQDVVEDKAIESWIRDAVSLTAAAAVEALQELSKQDSNHSTREIWSNLIINRILRGVLWTIHNRNAPGLDPLAKQTPNYDGDDRRLECSLSFKLLVGNEIVYIS